MEKELNELGILFQQITADIKSSFPLWEDFTNKAVKLHSALRCTVSASTVFLDAFQKLTDTAVGSKGSNNDIGSSLTKLCLRERSMENRLKAYTTAIAENLITPLQERIDDWKKGVVLLERERAKEYKKAHSEMKKASQETCRLQKKVNKGKLEYRGTLEEATREFNTRFSAMEATEKNSLTLALVEERSHLGFLINCLKPVMEHKIAMISEVEQLKEIMESLSKFAARPSSISEEIREKTNSYLPTNSTIERKKRALKEDSDCDSASTSSNYNHSSLEALNLCAASESSPIHQPFLPSSASIDRSQTISYGHYHSKLRPNLGFDVYSQQNGVCASPKQENPYAVPSTLPSSVQTSGPKVVDKIYSRPALIMNKENGSTLKRVMTPTVPNLEVLNAKTDGGANSAGMKVGQNLSKSDSTNASNEMSLADALRELQESTAQLQYPYDSFGAPSCHSLQCSSGYGTMTNVSATSSVETISSNQTDLDALTNALMESCNFPDLDKYSTLPNKSQIQGSFPREPKRPASTAGFQSVSTANELLNEVKGIPSFPAAYSADHIYSSSFAKGAPMSLQHDADILPRSVRNQNPSHLAVSVEEDDLDDLPLPPPPEELSCPANPVLLRRSSEPQQLLAHTGVMQSLNAKLSAMRSSAYDKDRPYRDVQRSSSLAQQNSDEASILGTQRTIFRQECLPQDNGSGANHFEHMIQRGVKLRHTICNDRSAPRLMRH